MRRRGRIDCPIIALRLNLLHDLEHVAQAFVVDDRPLIYRAELVVDGVGQSLSSDPNLYARVWILD